MTYSALMVDVDGVLVIRPDGRRWDADLQADLGVDPGDLQRVFFDPHWQAIATGRARIEDHLPAALATIAPHVEVEALIAYWFARDAHLNQPLLDDLAQLRASGVPVHLATVQEHRRADYLWTALGFSGRFDGLHHSAAVGHAKPDAAYFEAVAARVALRPADLLLIDDATRNVAAAIEAGWQARLWTGRQTLTELLAGTCPQ
jgi:putative hydrolase of the HAD superfamily